MAARLRDWVPAEHLVHFILEAVEALDLRQVRVNTRGTGREQYPPPLLLGLLLHSYATGTFGSRRLGQSTHDRVPVRLLTADTPPDHDTLCTFRRETQALLTECFVKVLPLAQQLQVLQFGQLAVAADGPKLLASASKPSGTAAKRRRGREKTPEEFFGETGGHRPSRRKDGAVTRTPSSAWRPRIKPTGG